jgi:predicted PurR-regulated permease PerM
MFERDELLDIEKRVVARLLLMLIRFGSILGLVAFCYTIFSPFMNLMLWGLILAVTLYPLHQRLAAALGQKQGRASTVLVLLGLVLIVAPTVVLASSLTGSVSGLVQTANSDSLQIPPPSDRLTRIPILGDQLHDLWTRAMNDLPGLLQSMQPELGTALKKVLLMLASLGGGVLGFILSFIVAGVIMAYGVAGARAARRIAVRLAGPERGAPLFELCTATIRAVALGVIGVAFIQAILSGLVMLMAGIPFAGILTILALILGVAQVPLILVNVPAVAYLWMAGGHSTAHNLFFTLLLLVAGMADNLLKPLLLGRGVDAPMPVVLLGALGGMATAGLLGMFIGATVLSIGYQLFMAWVDDELPGGVPEPAPNDLEPEG